MNDDAAAGPDSPSPEPLPTPLPAPPFVLVDTTTVEYAALALSRIEAWLATGEPAAVAECAHACSGGEEDAESVAAWAGTLADLLRARLEEARSWS